MRSFARAIATLAVFCACSFSAGAVESQAGSGDPRVRVVNYDPNEVVLLEGTLGYEISIEFGSGEKVENVSIGDSLGWQVMPNRRANLLFLKPRQRDAVTNMSVYTNLRRYLFDLRVRAPRQPLDSDLVFNLRFDYPEPASAAVVVESQPIAEPEIVKPQLPNDANHAYTYEGSSKNLPTRIFDDGHVTYFAFAETADYPAIFALDADDKEAVANVSVRNGYVIVDQLSRGFVLRRGSEVTKIFNDGYREEAPSPLSPKPRKDNRSFFERLFR